MPTPSVPTPRVPVPSVPARPVGSVVDTVQQAEPALPAPLQPTVDALNGTLDQTASTVDGVVAAATGSATKLVGGLLGGH